MKDSIKDSLDIIETWLDNPTAIQLIEMAIGILIIVIIVRLLKQSLTRLIQNGELRYRLRKGIAFIGYIIILLYIATTFSDRFGRISVIFGVIGAGVAFALQEVIASFAGWIAISFGQFYEPGDRVKLGNIVGDVIDISILRTTLMECGEWVKADRYNGRIVRIANSFVFKEPVFNYSGRFPYIWDEIQVPIKYGSDRVLARQIFYGVLERTVGEYILPAKTAWSKMIRSYAIEDAKIEPTVTLIATDNWIEFTLCYVVDYKQRRDRKDQLFSQILDEIDRTNGLVAIASTTVHLVQVPTLKMRIANDESD